MTTDESFEEFDETEFDDDLEEGLTDEDSQIVIESTDTEAVSESTHEQINEFVVVDNQITDYLDVESTETVPALFALPQTGQARVDDAIARLGDLENLPVNDHVEIFEDVQRRLHETLADLASS